MVRLIYYLRGYVDLLLSGQFIERFINICMHRGLLLWDIRKTGKHSAQVKMSLRAFRQTVPIARKTHTGVRILKKCGLPIRLASYKKRTFFLIGLLLAVSFLYISSLFIWKVDVVGCVRVPESEIREVLAQLGVHSGAYKRTLNATHIQNHALLRIDTISWLWVDIRGCTATVHILEKRPAPEILSTEACDIVAVRDAVILEMRATEGHKAVAVGDTVLKGQVLISSVMPSERINARYTHAAGLVYARTWYEESVTVPLCKTEKAYTGDVYTQRTLLLGSLRLPLSLKQELPKQSCERIENKHTFLLFGFNTHIAYQSVAYRSYTLKNVHIEKETAIHDAESLLDARIADMLCDKDATRTNAKTTVVENSDATLTVTRTAEYKEQIGKEQAVSALTAH